MYQKLLLSILFLVGALRILAPHPVLADLVLEGSEIQIHTTTIHNQLSPDVTANGGGGFVVGWTHVRQDGGENRDLWLRRFDAAGLPLTGELSGSVVSDRSTSRLRQLEADPSGAFVMGFTTQILCCDFYTNSLYLRFNADGTQNGALGGFRTVSGHDSFYGSIGVAPDGSFLLGWGVTNEAPLDLRGSYTRFVDASGTADAEETRQDTQTFLPVPAGSPLGGFLMYMGGEAFWLAADGTTTGPGFPLNLLPANFISDLRVLVLPSGIGVIVWANRDFGTDTSEVFARRIAPDGTLVGPIVTLTETPIPGFTTLDATVLPDGQYVVAWDRAATSGGARNVYARQFRSDGLPLSPEVLVNPSDFGDETTPRITATGADGLAAVWQNTDGQDGDEGGIYGQRLSVVPTPLFTDGFESGDVSAWSTVAP